MANEVDNRDRGKSGRNRPPLRSSGILSQDLTRAVINTGISAKTLSRSKKRLREILKPNGEDAELRFDRCWSCYLRLHLISRIEARLLVSGTASSNSDSLPILRESSRPRLILPDNDGDDGLHQEPENISGELIRALSLTARYDSHYSREFKSLLAELISMRDDEGSPVGTIVPTVSNSGGKDESVGPDDNGVYKESAPLK